MKDQKKPGDTLQEWEAMSESGYSWPKPERISIYIYPAQLAMIEEISRVWKKRKRDIFFEAIQQYCGVYFDWKSRLPAKEEPK